jgi:glycosyltransferase involved in cell wall biosynthesis
VTILMVNKFYYLRGGAERYAFDVSRLLERHGHRVIPFATRHPQNVPSPYDADFIPGPDFDAPGGPLGALAQAARVIYSPAARRAMGKVLARHRPDVVHLHNIAHHFSPSILDELGRAGVPVVQTVHDFKLLCPTYLMLCHGEVCERCAGGNVAHAVIHRCNRGSLLRSAVSAVESATAAARDAYRPVRRFLCPSRFLLEKLQTHGIAAERLIHLPLFVDPERLRAGSGSAPPGPSPGGGGDAEFALYAGRLAPEKGVRTLIAAARRIPQVPLKVAGEGPLAVELARERARGGLDHVELLGALSGETLVGLWRRARFTVVPSECYENSPLVVLESFALAKPVIGSRLGGIAELVGEDGAAGRLVPPRDPEALAGAMAELWAEPAAAAAMGEAGRVRVAARHTPEVHWAGLLAAYAAAGAPIGLEGGALDRRAPAGA